MAERMIFLQSLGEIKLRNIFMSIRTIKGQLCVKGADIYQHEIVIVMWL